MHRKRITVNKNLRALECARELGIVAAIKHHRGPKLAAHTRRCVRRAQGDDKPIAAYSASRFEMETRKTGLLFSAGSMT